MSRIANTPDFRSERGAIAVAVALGMTVFLGSLAIAIDLGHVMNTRAESQRVADLAALAAAAAFIQAPGNIDQTARDWAVDYAGRNTVDGTPVSLDRDLDVAVDLANERVRVTVRHSSGRGNPIPTIFARAIGIPSVDVVTTAVAEAAAGGGVNCMLPLMLPDRWEELGGNPDYYDPGIDYYEAWQPDGSNAGTATGYYTAHIGDTLTIKSNRGKGAPNPSWYYPIAAGDLQGGANYRQHIFTCPVPDYVYSVGDPIDLEPGNMVGPTKQGFNELVAQDPSALWDPAQQCVVDQLGGACRGSPRLRPMPMFDPTDTPDPGRKPVTITNFAGVFVLGVSGNEVLAVFTGYAAAVASGGSGSGTGPLAFKLLRLIE